MECPLPPGCLHPDIIYEYAVGKEASELGIRVYPVSSFSE
jgi:hypothetical protein